MSMTKQAAMDELYRGRDTFLDSSPDDWSLYQEAEEKHEQAIQALLEDL